MLDVSPAREADAETAKDGGGDRMNQHIWLKVKNTFIDVEEESQEAEPEELRMRQRSEPVGLGAGCGALDTRKLGLRPTAPAYLNSSSSTLELEQEGARAPPMSGWDYFPQDDYSRALGVGASGLSTSEQMRWRPASAMPSLAAAAIAAAASAASAEDNANDNSDADTVALPSNLQGGLMPVNSRFGPNASAPPEEWMHTTTVMMRNIPNKYTQRLVLTEINHTGFLGTFDFLYLPIDPETSANRGYAFLNFIDPSFAWMFKLSYEGRKMNKFNSGKVVSVVAATLQGFDANYTHYSAARVNRGAPAARPLFLREPSVSPGAVGGYHCGMPQGGRRGGRRRGCGGSNLDQLVAQQAATAAAMHGTAAGQWLTSPDIANPYFCVDGTCVGEDYLTEAATLAAHASLAAQAQSQDYLQAAVTAAQAQALAPEATTTAAAATGAPTAPPAQPVPPAPAATGSSEEGAPPSGARATNRPAHAKFCQHCGSRIQPLFVFCPHCGKSLEFSIQP
eukprot:TRINITY_DN23998_c0_g1_i2.p1 TRINITY_DN23998_c0_g1~~TRINITY_DN23998_c0_g1_i2.p1  ORF type:complete len:517 (+),score=103.18 TRINITY_DN23998_c0_g1_i2:28-1551(+)